MFQETAFDPEISAALFTGILIVVLAISGFVVNQRRIKRNHTINFISSFSSDPFIVRADYMVHKFCLEGDPLDFDKQEEDVHLNIRSLLTFYELLAHTYHENMVDRKTVAKFRGRAMYEAYKILRGYIGSIRKKLGRDGIYSDYETLVRELMSSGELGEEARQLAKTLFSKR